MRDFNYLVYDEVLVGNGPAYTDSDWNDRLAASDALALSVIVDNVTNTTGVAVQIQHCADGLNFENKNSVAEVSSSTISTSATNVINGADGGGIPSLGLVRLAITQTGTSAVAHFKVWATGRSNK